MQADSPTSSHFSGSGLREEPEGKSRQTQPDKSRNGGMPDEEHDEGDDAGQSRQRQEEEAADCKPLPLITAAWRVAVHQETREVVSSQENTDDPGGSLKKANRVVESNVDVHNSSLFLALS